MDHYDEQAQVLRQDIGAWVNNPSDWRQGQQIVQNMIAAALRAAVAAERELIAEERAHMLEEIRELQQMIWQK